MTPAQERMINKIKEVVTKEFLHSDNYEIKTWEVQECKYFVSLNVVTGLKNDEGTLAILTRNNILLFIGKRGGLSYMDNTATRKPLRNINLWEVLVAQRA